MFDSGLRLAKVVKTYPDGHSVDLVMYDDDSPQTNVQVLSSMATRRSGVSGLIDPTPPPDGEWGNQDTHDEDIYAVVGYMRGSPLVLGFIYPQVNQMTFPHKNRLTIRSPADLYATVDKDANFEMYHPSGAYIRFATDRNHEDLTAKDYDKKWKIDRNTDKRIHIHIEQAGGVAKVNIDPDGNISVTNDGRTDWHSKGEIAITSDTHIVMVAPTIDLNP